jgi:hypothetical protein
MILAVSVGHIVLVVIVIWALLMLRFVMIKRGR